MSEIDTAVDMFTASSFIAGGMGAAAGSASTAKANVDSIRQVAQDWRQTGPKIDQVVSALQATVQGTAHGWTGTDRTAFEQAVATYVSDLQALKTALTNAADMLGRSADAYQTLYDTLTEIAASTLAALITLEVLAHIPWSAAAAKVAIQVIGTVTPLKVKSAVSDTQNTVGTIGQQMAVAVGATVSSVASTTTGAPGGATSPAAVGQAAQATQIVVNQIPTTVTVPQGATAAGASAGAGGKAGAVTSGGQAGTNTGGLVDQVVNLFMGNPGQPGGGGGGQPGNSGGGGKSGGGATGGRPGGSGAPSTPSTAPSGGAANQGALDPSLFAGSDDYPADPKQDPRNAPAANQRNALDPSLFAGSDDYPAGGV